MSTIFTIHYLEKVDDKDVMKSRDSKPGQSGGDLWRELETESRMNGNIVRGSFTLTARKGKDDGTEARAL